MADLDIKIIKNKIGHSIYIYSKIIFLESGLDVVPSLHGGWTEMRTDEGRSFYVDLANMKCQWERPRHGSINSNFKMLISK